MKKVKKLDNKTKIGIGVTVGFCLLLLLVMPVKAELSLLDRVAQIAGTIWGNKLADDSNVGELSFGAFAGPDIYDKIIFHDRVSEVYQKSATSSAAASATLLQSDLLNTQLSVFTAAGAQDADFTYTLPASTTLTAFVSRIGERTENCWWHMASSTSSHSLVFAAGTGIDLVVSTTTTPVPLGVAQDQLVCIEFFRQGAGTGLIYPGDVTAILKLYSSAD